jgi:hypothetical protein
VNECLKVSCSALFFSKLASFATHCTTAFFSSVRADHQTFQLNLMRMHAAFTCAGTNMESCGTLAGPQ